MRSNSYHPLITIAIPTFNRVESSLPKTLASASNQTYTNLEILVCDNCSEDGTSDFIDAYIDQRIVYVRHERNIGPQRNFNACVDNARGQYLLLLHDDDEIDPDFVAECVLALNGHEQPGLIRTGMQVVQSEGIRARFNDVEGNEFEDLVKAWFSNKTALYCCNTLIHTQTLRNIGGFHSKNGLFLDALSQLKVAAIAGHVNVNKLLATFHDHDDSFGSSARVTAWADDSFELMQEIVQKVDPRARGEIQAMGNRFFSRMNYMRLDRVDFSLGKLKTYGHIYKSFDHTESPWKWFWEKSFIRKCLQRVTRKANSLVQPRAIG